MPDMFGHRHDRVLQASESLDTAYFADLEDRIIFGKHASGSIFAATILVKKLISFSGDAHRFVAIIKTLKRNVLEGEGFLLVDLSMRIRHVSQELIPFLHFNNHVLQFVSLKFTDLCPGYKKLPLGHNPRLHAKNSIIIKQYNTKLLNPKVFSDNYILEIFTPNILRNYETIINTKEQGFGLIHEKDAFDSTSCRLIYIYIYIYSLRSDEEIECV